MLFEIFSFLDYQGILGFALPAIVGGGSLLGGGAAAAGVGSAVAGGLALGGAQGLFSSKQAQRNRNFQRTLSDTAYQRAAADLEAAGLNRILAVGQPASTPAGATANADIASSAKMGALLNQELNQLKANIRNTNQQTKTGKALELKAMADASTARASEARLRSEIPLIENRARLVSIDAQLRQNLISSSEALEQLAQWGLEVLKTVDSTGKDPGTLASALIEEIDKNTDLMMQRGIRGGFKERLLQLYEKWTYKKGAWK